jgi:hypothetical protein
VYGGRVNPGFAVFVAFRPAAMTQMSIPMPMEHGK